MIKIFNTTQIREADEYTIIHEPTKSVLLMERAANAFVQQLQKDFSDIKIPKYIFCGCGNNGGDGLAIARILLNKKEDVNVYILKSKKYTDGFSLNLKRLEKKNKKRIHYISDISFIKKIPFHSVIIDAIFGTGLNAPIAKDSIQYQLIQELNNQKFYSIIAVDIPSGLLADRPSNGISILADKTYTFQFPKLSFLLPESGKYVNDFKILDIGLHADYIAKTATSFYYTTTEDIRKKIKVRKKYSHKGNYGHALIIAGSYGKMGAAVLSGKASLRSGCGLVTVHSPKCGYEIMQTAFPEAMCSTDKNEKYFTDVSTNEKYDAIAIGPGIGTNNATIKAFKIFLSNTKTPVIIDADAINILAKKKSFIKLLPENSILTPHPKEFERLAGKWKNDFERLELQQNFSKKHRVIIVLKGANTCISDIHGNVYFNSTGNAGMATAGSGDVLTGIVTGLFAQQYSPSDSAVTGVFIHGLSGDLALEKQSMESLIASDIIDNLGNVFKLLKTQTIA